MPADQDTTGAPSPVAGPLPPAAPIPARRPFWYRWAGTGLLGVLSFARSCPWTPDDVEMLGAVAGQVATALENRVLNVHGERRAAQQRLLHEVSQYLPWREKPALNDLFDRVVQAYGRFP